jgi:hypothetical protein
MRRGKEFVPTDRPMPGNIPQHPDYGEQGGQGNRVQVNRQRGPGDVRQVASLSCGRSQGGRDGGRHAIKIMILAYSKKEARIKRAGV